MPLTAICICGEKKSTLYALMGRTKKTKTKTKLFLISSRYT